MLSWTVILWCVAIVTLGWTLKWLWARGALIAFPELQQFDRGARLEAFVRAASNRATTIIALPSALLFVCFLVWLPRYILGVFPEAPAATVRLTTGFIGVVVLLIFLPSFLTRSTIRGRMREELAGKGHHPANGV